jgi:hypothetical protein
MLKFQNDPVPSFAAALLFDGGYVLRGAGFGEKIKCGRIKSVAGKKTL